jgi:hypothetical protein
MNFGCSVVLAMKVGELVETLDNLHRKMLVGQERLHLAVVQKLGHELLKDIAALQTLPVLGEGRLNSLSSS